MLVWLRRFGCWLRGKHRYGRGTVCAACGEQHVHEFRFRRSARYLTCTMMGCEHRIVNRLKER